MNDSSLTLQIKTKSSKEASYDHLNEFYDKVGEDGKNLTHIFSVKTDKIIVCGSIWAVAIILKNNISQQHGKKEL